MKPLWASVFMMLAMFLQSSAERTQRCRVRATIRLGAVGTSSETPTVQLRAQPLCPHQSQVPWSSVGRVWGPLAPQN